MIPAGMMPARVKTAIASGMVARERAITAATDPEAAYQAAVTDYLGPPLSESSWRAACPREDCMCTHTHPCDRGWTDLPDLTRNAQTYRRTAPCAVCRPTSYDRYARSIERGSTNRRT